MRRTLHIIETHFIYRGHFTGKIRWIVLLISLIMANICGCSVNASVDGLAAFIKGRIFDETTNEPLEYVNITNLTKHRSVLSDEEGHFRILGNNGDSIAVYSMGYEDWRGRIGDISDTLYMRLYPKQYELSEVVVKPKKQKYSKKNNPALDLVRKVKSSYDKMDPTSNPDYNYTGYSKIVLGVNNYKGTSNTPTEEEGLSKPGIKQRLLQSYIDTAFSSGKTILDLSVKERVFQRIHKGNSKKPTDIIIGLRENGIDEMVGVENVRIIIDDILREIDVHGNDIYIFQNKFVSPLGAISDDFYHYFITDTLRIGNDKCVEISFSPRNPQTFSFNGKLYIVPDSVNPYLRRVRMRIPKDINMNYAKSIVISQNFIKDSIGEIHKTLDDLSVELKFLPGTPELYAARRSRYHSFSHELPDSLNSYMKIGGDQIDMIESGHRSEKFWETHRRLELSRAEASVQGIMKEFRKSPILYWGEKIVKVLAQGYIRTGQKSLFDIGPVNTMLSYNSVEGLRLRAGGMTTANLSQHLFLKGYAAYGCKDRKWKYNIEGVYSFVGKKYHSREFPRNDISLQYEYDLDHIGQHYLYTNSDNVFLSLKRMQSDLVTYRRLINLAYILELRNNLSINIGIRGETQYASPWVEFIKPDGSNVSSYHQRLLKASIRFAPGEKFVESADSRRPINMDAPIFMLTQEYGRKGFLGSDFTINKTEFSFSKRFWLSAFGYINSIIKLGKVWSEVPFPSLLWQNSNLSYTIQPESYSLLNPMELAMDSYGSWDFQYYMNGLIFNRIPFIRKAKLREILGFKGFMGHLSKRNNPEYNPKLFRFPLDSHTRPMGSTPYMEVSVGLDNIFTILRVDYVWRLNYRNLPDIDHSGLRISLHFSF